MDLVVVFGKSKKNVQAYILNPMDAKDKLNVLITTRDEVKVSQTNPYIFARLNSDTPLSGITDLRDIVSACPDLKHPEKITSNNIEKVCRDCLTSNFFQLDYCIVCWCACMHASGIC